jgi:hypothetical protein
MNNTEVEGTLVSCNDELKQVKALIDHLGITSNIVPYLTKYAIIKACGTIEASFKSLIADHCSRRCKKQIKQFLDRRIRDGSANPSFDNICKFLRDFDQEWNDNFKSGINNHPDGATLKTSLQSLVDARNDFAHGGNPTLSITDVLKYYDDSKKVIQLLDGLLT